MTPSGPLSLVSTTGLHLHQLFSSQTLQFSLPQDLCTYCSLCQIFPLSADFSRDTLMRFFP